MDQLKKRIEAHPDRYETQLYKVLTTSVCPESEPCKWSKTEIQHLNAMILEHSRDTRILSEFITTKTLKELRTRIGHMKETIKKKPPLLRVPTPI